MDIKQNLLKALRGEKASRVPIMMREGFGSWYDPTGSDNFTHEWMLEKEYQRMADVAKEVGVAYYRAHETSFTNRFMMTNNAAISVKTQQTNPDLKTHFGKIDVGGGEFLTFTNQTKRGLSTEWNVDVPVGEWEDVEKIMSIPFEVDPSGLKEFQKKISYLEETSDERTVNCIFVPSPVVAISRGMHFDFFLENSIVEEERIKEILDIITEREILLMKQMLPLIPKDMILWVGALSNAPHQ